MESPRQNRRLARLVRGTLTVPSGNRHALLIQNISRFGIGARFSAEPLNLGDKVKVAIPNIGVFEGKLCWQRNGRIGIELENAVDTEAVHFENNAHLEVKPPSFKVSDQFKPVSTSWRPGFGRKK